MNRSLPEPRCSRHWTARRLPRTLFRLRAFNPELECGVLTRAPSLEQAADHCVISDLPRLLKELNASARA